MSATYLRVLREANAASALPQLQRDGAIPHAKRGKRGKRRKARESVPIRLVLREARIARKGTSFEATVIREGAGNPTDRRYYTRQALQKAVREGLFEGLQCYADHPTASEEKDQPERSVRKLIGHFREARLTDESGKAAVRARFVPIQGAGYEWVTSLIESSLAAPVDRPLIGISIDGFGDTDGTTQSINGRDYELIREISLLASADLVTRTATGGRFHRRLQEAWRTTGPARMAARKEKTMNAKTFRRRFREAVSSLDQAARLPETDEHAERLASDAIGSLRKLAEAKLTTKQRKKLPKRDFAEPEKDAYPIEDKAHARDALSRVSTNGTAAERAEVRDAVADKYPQIKQTKGKNKKRRSREAAAPARGVQQVSDTTAELAQVRAQLESERKLREAAEAKVADARRKAGKAQRADLASRVLREAGIPAETAAVWLADIADAKTEKRMRRLVEARKADRDRLLREAMSDIPVEGAGPRVPLRESAPVADTGICQRLGINPDDYVPAGAGA